jgi:hypothetical protein
VKASAADTGGRYTVDEITASPRLQAPLHVRYREDEGFYVLDGTVTIQVGEATAELGPGHRFTVGPERARMIWVLTPSGFEDFVEEASVPAEAPTVSPEIVPRHGNELLPG